MTRDAYLVVGGDSLVGGGLVRALERRGRPVYASTRRKDTVGGRRVYLDFEDPAPPRLPADIGYAFVVAAATNYDRCEKDPLAHKINVEYVPRTVAALLEQGLFVTYISTNSVFGGERPWPNEDDPHAPGIAYARQKSESEAVVRAATRKLGAEDRLNITRLTKILDRSTSPLPAWFSAWEKGETVQPFSDLIFAPMTVRFVGEALATLGEKRVAGNLHLSGADNVSYPKFAATLAERLKVDPKLISPTTSVAKGIHIPFKPTYSGLGMKRTTALCGVKPQTIDEVAAELTAKNTA